MTEVPYALPECLQISVAIATIISSLAVIAYFTQIAISIKQFRRQLTISTDQFNLAQSQSRLVNQGYISPEFESGLFNPNLAGAKMTPDMVWNNITVSVKLTNTGNTPVIFEIENFELYFNDLKKYSLPAEYKTKGSIYPKQITVFGLASFPLNEHNDAIDFNSINALNITYSILIKYHDINDNRLKQVKRTMKFLTDGTHTNAVYTNVEDSI